MAWVNEIMPGMRESNSCIRLNNVGEFGDTGKVGGADLVFNDASFQ